MTSEPEDEQEKCRLYAKWKLSAINPRHKEKGNKYCNSLTQHGGSSRISIKGKKRDSNYRIIPDRVCV